MLLGFDPFREGMDIELLRHLHDGGRDPHGALGEGPKESHIELELIEGDLLEHVQGGVGASEIVHPDLVAGGVELLYDSLQQLLLLGHHALRDLEINEVMGDFIIADDIVHKGEDIIAQEKIQPGEIDRYRNRCLTVGQAPPDPGTDAAKDRLIEMMDDSLALQHRDELVRVNDAKLRIDPPRQGFEAAELAGGGADDRLIKGLNLVKINRLLVVILDVIIQISAHDPCLLSFVFSQYTSLRLPFEARCPHHRLFHRYSCRPRPRISSRAARRCPPCRLWFSHGAPS